MSDIHARNVHDMPRIGLALGAGSARGLAHIGVLKVLEEGGIPITCIAGSSAGALVGGIYAATGRLDMMEKLAYAIGWEHLVDITVPRMGLIAGNKMLEFLDLLTQGKRFADLHVPFAAVAVDIELGEEVVFKEGCGLDVSVAEAIRASTAIPGIFAPVRLGGKLLVDGAVLNRVPVDVVREMGVDVTIAVSIVGRSKGAVIRNIFEVITSSVELMEWEILGPRLNGADVVIEPDLADIGPTRLDMAKDIIARGEEAARAALPEVRSLIEGFRVKRTTTKKGAAKEGAIGKARSRRAVAEEG